MGSAVQDEFDLAGSALSDRYDIERVAASGGYGVVYFGRHRALKGPIAVKVLRTPKDLTAAEERDFAERFLAEAQTIAELHHAAVVRPLDFGVSAMPNGKVAPWTVFEWVSGQTLKEFMDGRKGEPMAPRDALALLQPVFEGLAAAHAMGIAHRDVKPANIMLPSGTHGLASRILDFGIAKTMDPDEKLPTGHTRTRSGAVGYSLPYASPEQIGNARTGPWTDVHALALVLTELLVGRAPLEGEDEVEVTSSALSATRPTPRAFGVDVGAWEPVIARAMALKSSMRYPNAAEFLAALEEHAPYEPLAITTSGALRRPGASTLKLARSPVSDSTLRTSEIPIAPRPSGDARGRWVLPALGVLALASVLALAVNLSRPAAPAPAAANPVPTVTSAPEVVVPRPAPLADVPAVTPSAADAALAVAAPAPLAADAAVASPTNPGGAPNVRQTTRVRRAADAGSATTVHTGPVEIAPNI